MNFSSFKRRLLSRTEIVATLGVVVFFVYTWSMRGFLYKFPSLMLYLSAGEILAIFFYMMAFALLESLFVTAGLVVLGFLLPENFLRQDFSRKSFIVVFVGAAMMIFFQATMRNETTGFPLLFKGIGMFLVALMLLIPLIHRLASFQRVVDYIVDGLGVFVFFYVPLGIVSMLIVVIRNLF